MNEPYHSKSHQALPPPSASLLLGGDLLRPVSVVSPDVEGEGSDQTDLDEAGKAGRQAVLLMEKNWWSQTVRFSQRAERRRVVVSVLSPSRRTGPNAPLTWEGSWCNLIYQELFMSDCISSSRSK